MLPGQGGGRAGSQLGGCRRGVVVARLDPQHVPSTFTLPAAHQWCWGPSIECKKVSKEWLKGPWPKSWHNPGCTHAMHSTAGTRGVLASSMECVVLQWVHCVQLLLVASAQSGGQVHADKVLGMHAALGMEQRPGCMCDSDLRVLSAPHPAAAHLLCCLLRGGGGTSLPGVCSLGSVRTFGQQQHANTCNGRAMHKQDRATPCCAVHGLVLVVQHIAHGVCTAAG